MGMIQRIQTIYLLISLIAWSILFFIPTVGIVNGSGGEWWIFPKGVMETASLKTVMETVLMLVYFALVEILILISILTYGKRERQLRITLLNMILQILSYGLIALYLMQARNSLNIQSGTLRVTVYAVIPLLAAICSFLAYRGIKKDIRLLKSLDRLR